MSKIFVHVHPDQVPKEHMAELYDYHYGEMQSLTKLHQQSGATLEQAAARAGRTAVERFMKVVPEFTGHGADWHEWHSNIIDRFAKDKGLIKEDAPTNAMTGGHIASRDIHLGGAKVHLLKREILSTVLGKVRAKARTRVS